MVLPAPGARRTAWRRLPLFLRVGGVVILLAYPVAAGALLLTSDGWAVNRANVSIWHAVTGAVGLRDHISPETFAMLANVVLFIPFFAALALLVPTWWWVLLGAGLSTAVEVYQGSLGSRIQDVGDIVANTLGAALGVGLGLVLHHRALSVAGSDPTAPTTRVAPPGDSAHARGGGPDDLG